MKVSRLLIAGAVAALLPFAGAVAQSSTPQQGAQPSSQGSQQGATFESLDTNSDGKISKTEAAANSNVAANFDKYDQDGNGFIERSEVNAGNRSQPDDQSKQ